MTSGLLTGAAASFVVATFLFARWLLTAASYRPRSGTVAVVVGAGFVGASLFQGMSGAAGGSAFGLGAQVILMVTLGLVILSLVPGWQLKAPIVQPAIGALAAAASLSLAVRQIWPLPAPDSTTTLGAITSIHIGATLLGFVLFVPSYVLSILFLHQEQGLRSREMGSGRLPSLLTTEQVAWRLVLLGFPLYSIGILLGLLWQEQSASTPTFRPAHVLAVLSWALYAWLSYRRLTSGWRGRRASLMAICAFCLTLSAVLLYGMR